MSSSSECGSSGTHSQLNASAPSVQVPPFLLCFLSIASYACVLALVLLPAAGLGAPLGRELAPSADEVGPTAAMLLLCAYDLVCALAVISFVKAARIAPGAIPLWLCSREPGDQAYFHNVLQAVEKKADGSLRFCTKCGAFKPDRTHHCPQLGQCVLVLQHWSVWCNNAVGFYNYKCYLLALLYAGLAHGAVHAAGAVHDRLAAVRAVGHVARRLGALVGGEAAARLEQQHAPVP